jgi:transposase
MSTAPEARQALDLILELFMVERKAMSRGIVGTREHLHLRRTRSVEVLGRLLGWMKETIPLYEPSSAMGTALKYMQNQWYRLTAFVDDPLIPINNNAAEAALRIIALARKNSLFFGNDAAGERFAILYSLIATCEKHDVNPLDYFTDVLIRIQDHPKARIAELLPHRWKEPSTSLPIEPAPPAEPAP